MNPYEKAIKQKQAELADREDVFENIEYLYHVTCSAIMDKIESCGLLVRRFPDNEYHESDKVKRAIICFCGANKLNDHIESVKSKCSDRIIICRVAASDIQNLDFGLDWTFSGTESLTGDKWKIIKTSLNDLGTIAVYENVPFELITLLDRDLNPME